MTQLNSYISVFANKKEPNVVLEWLTLHLYSGDTGFKARPGDRMSWLRFSVLSSPSNKKLG
jgi:hypothetical protein